MNDVQQLFVLVVQTGAIVRDMSCGRLMADQVVASAPVERIVNDDRATASKKALAYVDWCYHPDHTRLPCVGPPPKPDWMQ